MIGIKNENIPMSTLDHEDIADEIAMGNEVVIPCKCEKKALSKMERTIEDLKKQSSDFKDKFIRTKAEMDNLIKRTDREIESTKKYSIERIISDILPIVDGLEKSVELEENEGTKIILDMIYKMLQKYHVHAINPINQKFDHDRHSAISTVQKEGIESNVVVEVMQKGYMLYDRLIRPAIVTVSQ